MVEPCRNWEASAHVLRSKLPAQFLVGEVTDVVRPPNDGNAIACALGGPDRRTLLMAVCRDLPGTGHLPEGNAWIDALEVEVPGAGRP